MGRLFRVLVGLLASGSSLGCSSSESAQGNIDTSGGRVMTDGAVLCRSNSECRQSDPLAFCVGPHDNLRCGPYLPENNIACSADSECDGGRVCRKNPYVSD